MTHAFGQCIIHPAAGQSIERGELSIKCQVTNAHTQKRSISGAQDKNDFLLFYSAKSHGLKEQSLLLNTALLLNYILSITFMIHFFCDIIARYKIICFFWPFL